MKGPFPQSVPWALIVAVLISLSFPGCSAKKEAAVTAVELTGITGSDFSGTWWNYYQRALVYAEQGLYTEAEKDLQQAVQGNDFDQRDISIPDGNMIEYFPHRELGILYYQRKELESAIEELLYSIESEPSSRADYFLDQARSSKIKRDGLDKTPPVLTLKKSSTVEATSSLSKHITGVAMDDTFVSSVTIDGISIPLEFSTEKKIFTADVPLQEGENTITVKATDLSGKSSSETLEIHGDFCGPLVEITGLTAENGMISVNGNVSDTGGLVSLKINGHKWPITGHFQAYNFTFTQPSGTVTITAKDRAGNITQAVFGEADSSDDPEDLDQSTDVFLPDPSLTDLSGENGAPPLPDPSDLNDPGQSRISLEGMFETRETYDESIELKIRISNDGGLHSIFFNTSPILPKMGRIVYFTIKRKLRPGENEFHIVAFDRQGNKQDKKITVTRKVANIHQYAFRMKLAVLPFAWRENTEHPRYNVAERLAVFFAERQRFQTADVRQTEAFAEKLTHDGVQSLVMDIPAEGELPDAVDAVLTGSINISSEYGEIIGRLVDVRTSKVMDVQDVFGKVAGEQDIEALTCRLAEKFIRDLPIRKGMIEGINENRVTINLGTQDGIKPYSTFLIYRESPPFIHPVTKNVILSDPEILGTLQVKEVQEQSAAAEIISTVMPVRQYDRIIAK